ncbi:UNVERIFIED_CONTAM: hypothetical protein FKN15_009375 [Acipenser sinensis]
MDLQCEKRRLGRARFGGRVCLPPFHEVGAGVAAVDRDQYIQLTRWVRRRAGEREREPAGRKKRPESERETESESGERLGSP